MKQQLVRDVLGRINGLVSDYWDTSDESYTDIKCKDVRFPDYGKNLNGKVHTYHISELHKKN